MRNEICCLFVVELHHKPNNTRPKAQRYLVMMLDLRVVLFEESQESLRVRTGVVCRKVSGFRRTRSSKRRFGGVICGEVRGKVGGDGGHLGLLGRREGLYDADMCIFRLERRDV